MEKFDTDTPQAVGLIAAILGLGSLAAGMVAGGIAIKLESGGAQPISLFVIAAILAGGGVALAFTGGICGHSAEKITVEIGRLQQTIKDQDQAIAWLRCPPGPRTNAAQGNEEPRITALREERDRLIAEARDAVKAGRDKDVAQAQIQFITDEFEKKGVAA